jgi:hemoglobin
MNTQASLYDLLGGERNLLSLVDRFYFYMDILPEATDIRGMHAESLVSAREKLFKFLSGWLGGPNLYIEAYGHPRLRMRHFPFKIGPNEKDQWMICMKKAFAEIECDSNVKKHILSALDQLAEHMINS